MKNAKKREAYDDNQEGKNVKLEVALLYAASGVPVVPLHGAKRGRCTCGNEEHCLLRGRHSRTKYGLGDATTDAKLVKKFWKKWPQARIGVVMDAGLIAVVAKGKVARESLRKLEKENTKLPPTVTIRDGDRHIILLKGGTDLPVRKVELMPALTILGAGNLLVSPSRRGKSQAKRRFVDGQALGETEIAAAPPWLLVAIGAKPTIPAPPTIVRVAIDDIEIDGNRRQLHPEKVRDLASKIAVMGLHTPLTVRHDYNGRIVLVAGFHRLEAGKLLGWAEIDCFFMEGDEVDARLWEISENLDRVELTALERANMVDEWARSGRRTGRFLLAVVGIDTARNIIENLYFGLYFGAQYGLFPGAIVGVLGNPNLLIIPKVINVAAACVVLGLLLLRWLPASLRERANADDDIRQKTNSLSQETEERRRLFETSLDLILITDRRGNFLRVSPSSRSILGYDPEEMVGHVGGKYIISG
jgi:ParB/RepB/Spo0J family partition protein